MSAAATQCEGIDKDYSQPTMHAICSLLALLALCSYEQVKLRGKITTADVHLLVSGSLVAVRRQVEVTTNYEGIRRYVSPNGVPNLISLIKFPRASETLRRFIQRIVFSGEPKGCIGRRFVIPGTFP